MEPETLRTKGEPSVDLEKAISTLGIDVSVLEMSLVTKMFSLEVPDMYRRPFFLGE